MEDVLKIALIVFLYESSKLNKVDEAKKVRESVILYNSLESQKSKLYVEGLLDNFFKMAVSRLK